MIYRIIVAHFTCPTWTANVGIQRIAGIRPFAAFGTTSRTNRRARGPMANNRSPHPAHAQSSTTNMSDTLARSCPSGVAKRRARVTLASRHEPVDQNRADRAPSVARHDLAQSRPWSRLHEPWLSWNAERSLRPTQSARATASSRPDRQQTAVHLTGHDHLLTPRRSDLASVDKLGNDGWRHRRAIEAGAPHRFRSSNGKESSAEDR
jgi:hypothetical protein